MQTLKGFRGFLLRGNVVDLAVGIVIGAAFGTVVTAFVAAFLTPLIGLLTGATGDFSKQGFHVGKVLFPVGQFITALIAFVLIAFAVYFFVVVPVSRLLARMNPHTDVEAPKQDCPECLSTIPAGARRCAFCTAQLLPAARTASGA
ncbi:MAG: mscL 1 [Actinomycetia bacterium]|jgi:large conductance mechanosensitive channel|nr:mscL 1 [Actinomycetes bacterium]MDQ1657286.1 large conductance mechanosensitive channel [Cryptosporangiaceae bacterium]